VAGDAWSGVGARLLLADRLDPPDLETARGWYERAAEAGDPYAMNDLVVLLATQLNPPDLETARE
jgi:TPR repeat protein